MATINNVPLADRTRFATAFVFSKDRQAIDWDAAATRYGGDVLAQSFRTVTQRALKKAVDSGASVPEGDINRFALCYIYAKNQHGVDWDQAAKAYDPKVLAASFRTVTQRALKKVDFAPQSAVAAKKPRAKKRKGADNEDDADYDGNDDPSIKPKKAKARKTNGKAAKKEVQKQYDDTEAGTDIAVKDEKPANDGSEVAKDDWNHSPGLTAIQDELESAAVHQLLHSTEAEVKDPGNLLDEEGLPPLSSFSPSEVEAIANTLQTPPASDTKDGLETYNEGVFDDLAAQDAKQLEAQLIG